MPTLERPVTDHLAQLNHPPLTALTAMFQVSTYRGVAAGWQAVGKPRSADSAAQLLALLNRVRPDYSNRQSPAN